MAELKPKVKAVGDRVLIAVDTKIHAKLKRFARLHPMRPTISSVTDAALEEWLDREIRKLHKRRRTRRT